MFVRYTTYLLPYRDLSNDDRFVIWGCGTIGRALVRQWEVSRIGTLIAVVDERAAQMEYELPYPVHTPEYLQDHQDFTKIIIAIRKKEIVKEIEECLQSWGVARDKILTQPALERHSVPVPERWLKKPTIPYARKMSEIFQIWNVQGGATFVRVGAPQDGGYVMLDDFHRSGIAYSFGISNDVTWDRDMAGRGYDIYMYDHTIDGLPEERPEFHFARKGIAGEAIPPFLDTLPHYMDANHHKGCRHMILKMDVEGAEWGALSVCPKDILRCFDQIVIEYHDLMLPHDETSVLATLEKLNATHAPIHVHANNYGHTLMVNGRMYPDVLEVTYANRDTYDCRLGGRLYTEFDAPCDPEYPEIYLPESD